MTILPRFRIPAFIDGFLLALLATAALALLLPCRGASADLFGILTDIAIGMLFFLHGAKLPRSTILDGIGNWRLHLTVLASSFVLLPVIGLALRAGLGRWVDKATLDGILFLCLLPSTVQSSIAFTAIARGNVPAAVCSASLSNVLGIFVTPLLVSVFLLGRAGLGGVSPAAIGDILLQLLLPFVLGHLSRPMTAGWIHRHRRATEVVDRGSILLVVYTAFSASVVAGLWHSLSIGDLLIVLLLDGSVLATALTATAFAARRLGFGRADRIAIVFCGSKKSLASGAPMASVLFPAALVGPMILPVILFHQMQLMVCSFLARRYAADGRI